MSARKHLQRLTEAWKRTEWTKETGPEECFRAGYRAATHRVGKDTLVQWLEAGSSEVYDETADENMVELSERGAELCEEHGLTVDVDAYGCAYCVEHTIQAPVAAALLPRATPAQPVEQDDIRRPREVQLLLEQLAAVGLTLIPLSAQRHLPDGVGASNSALRRAVGIAGSFHVALAELGGAS